MGKYKAQVTLSNSGQFNGTYKTALVPASGVYVYYLDGKAGDENAHFTVHVDSNGARFHISKPFTSGSDPRTATSTNYSLRYDSGSRAFPEPASNNGAEIAPGPRGRGEAWARANAEDIKSAASEFATNVWSA